MKVKHFIWDFDGTIIDTYPHTTTAFLDTMRTYGIQANYDEAIVLLRHSLSSVRSVYSMSDEMFERFLARALEMWFEPLPVPYEGIEKVLKAVVSAGGKNFLYTHRNDTALKYLSHYNLLRYFTECVYNESPAFVFKPAPDSITYIIEKHGLCKEEVAMVGDREIDVMSGKNAGCRAVLFDEHHTLKDSCADEIIFDITKITDFIA